MLFPRRKADGHKRLSPRQSTANKGTLAENHYQRDKNDKVKGKAVEKAAFFTFKR
jgi:hypothetical protein